jgi:hypothetical protein
MLDLLLDESAEVRVCAAQGVCSVIRNLWPSFPLSFISRVLAVLVGDLAFDASSPKVRAASLLGLKSLLACEQSHLILKRALPKLTNVIHDVNEEVRMAMIELLIAIKHVKAIHFKELCSMDDVLARLALDSVAVATRIVSLIENSFFPYDKDENVKIQRALYLIRFNRNASRRCVFGHLGNSAPELAVSSSRFYHILAKSLPFHDCVRFMLAILIELQRGASAELARSVNKENVDRNGSAEAQVSFEESLLVSLSTLVL